MYNASCKVPHVDLVPMMKLAFKFGVDPLKEQCAARLFEEEELGSIEYLHFVSTMLTE
jgi:hypothetical protein